MLKCARDGHYRFDAHRSRCRVPVCLRRPRQDTPGGRRPPYGLGPKSARMQHVIYKAVINGLTGRRTFVKTNIGAADVKCLQRVPWPGQASSSELELSKAEDGLAKAALEAVGIRRGIAEACCWQGPRRRKNSPSAAVDANPAWRCRASADRTASTCELAVLLLLLPQEGTSTSRGRRRRVATHGVGVGETLVLTGLRLLFLKSSLSMQFLPPSRAVTCGARALGQAAATIHRGLAR